MNHMPTFNMNFIGQETHLVLPTVTSIVLVQNLYDVLFQYALTPEQEAQLEAFIKKLEAHIKKKSRAPFSMPSAELEFLGEGLEELRLLNWMELPVLKFALVLPPEEGRSPEAEKELVQSILETFDDYMVLNRAGEPPLIYLYPYRITAY